MNAWQRGQGLLSKKRGNSMLRGNQDDDEDYTDRNNKSSRFIKRTTATSVLADFAKATTALRTAAAADPGAAAGIEIGDT
jgi:hypothetical protein